MFTGIVEEIGKISSVRRGRNSAEVEIEGKTVLEDIHIGDSIAVNGVCLTVTGYSRSSFTADVMHETLDRTSLKGAASGMQVNLERAMAADGRFGGHIVSGHIDGTGTVKKIEKDDNAVWYTIAADSRIMKYIVEKGSVALDGTSLTVADVTENDFSVSIIPHTLSETVIGIRKTGDTINIETDVIGKYVEKLMHFRTSSAENESADGSGRKNGRQGITEEFLVKHGFGSL